MSLLNRQYKWLARVEPVCLLLVMVGVFIARCQSVAGYPIHDDELISFAVMQSIVSDGLPLTGVGEVYWRSFPTYYLMAIPLFWMNPGMLAYRLVTVLCSVLVLMVAFRLCRSAHGRLAAWLAVAFLAMSSYQNLFAAFSRFYMPFQLFFLASLYFAGSYFIQGRSRAGWGLLACTFLAIGSHNFAVLLVPVVVLAWFLGRRPKVWKNTGFVSGLLLLCGWSWLNWVWQPGNVHTGSLALPLILGGLEDKLAFIKWFRNFTPGGITLLLLGVYPALRERNPWWLFLYGSFALCLVSLSLVAPADNPRYMIHFYPLGVVLSCMALAWWLCTVYRYCRHPQTIRFSWWGIVALMIFSVSIGYAATKENLAFSDAFGTHVKFSNQKPAHDYMSMLVPSGAIVMSTDPGFTAYYLGRRADYWLREQYDEANNRYQPFMEEDKLKYPPEFFVDSPEKLAGILRETEREIWLYANQKFDWGLSSEMKTIVAQNFYQRYKAGNSKVLYRPSGKKPDADSLP